MQMQSEVQTGILLPNSLVNRLNFVGQGQTNGITEGNILNPQFHQILDQTQDILYGIGITIRIPKSHGQVHHKVFSGTFSHGGPGPYHNQGFLN